MPIKTGDRLPTATLRQLRSEGIKEVNTHALCAGRTVVLFALPGAFTPTCSAAHLPGFVAQADPILAHGVDAIGCVSVNDAFVMDAWGKAHNAALIDMLADGVAEFTAALGLSLDLTAHGLGIRSQRYAMIVEDGVVRYLGIDDTPGVNHSSAERILAELAKGNLGKT